MKAFPKVDVNKKYNLPKKVFFCKKSRHLVLDDLYFFRVFVTAWSFDSARFRQKLFDFRRCLELFAGTAPAGNPPPG